MKKKLLVILLIILAAVLCINCLAACTGVNGQDGVDGKDGVGIGSIVVGNNGDLIIYDTAGKVIFQGKIPQCHHYYGNSTEALKPTCVAAGYLIKTCIRCGEKDYEVIPATGHSWNGGTVVNEATCLRNGLKVYSCTACEQTKVEVIPATEAHSYVNGVCEYCNQTRAKILNNYYNGKYGYDYFATLNNGSKLTKLYNAIDDAVINFHDDETANAQLKDDIYNLLEINWEEYDLTLDEAVSVWKTYLDDKPLYYWISKTLSVKGDALILAVDEEYANGEARVAQNEKLYQVIAEYAREVKGKSAYDVAFALHDKIIDDIDYAYKGNGKPEDASWAHSIIGVFEKQNAVCEGYARAFQLLLNVCKVENVFVSGVSANVDHAWNLVRMDDGKYYWYDLTWDDTPNYYWGISHDYACATSADFNKIHTAHVSSDWGTNFLYDLPKASNTAYNGNELKYLDEFTLNGTTYSVAGYNKLNVKEITRGGDCVIPESVTYDNRQFKVVSISNFENGVSHPVLDYKVKYNSLYIPASVIYIDDFCFDSAYAENALTSITVDEQNPRFTSLDGVLFTKSLYTLIYYPHGNPQKEYAIPDQTVMIANGAFGNGLQLESLRIGKNLLLNGIANWGFGYPDSDRGGNIVSGGWNRIVRNMQGEKQITVDPENQVFKIKDGLLLNVSETFVYTCMDNVERLIIPDTVTDIETDAFNYYQNLKYAEIPAGVTELNRLFSDCRNLEEVVLHEGLLKIKDGTFWGCQSLKNIVLPNSLQIIEDRAFFNCESLASITIPSNVTEIGKAAFGSCPLLSEIKVAQDNQYFTVKGNCLINIETKTLISAFNNCTIPNDGSIEIIGEHAFYHLDITEIIIPDGVISIEECAFGNCMSLSTMVIPDSVTQIGDGVLTNTPIKDIFYCGTSEQWKEIEKAEYLGYYVPTVYFYSEEKPASAGNYWHYVNGVITKW